MAVEIEQLGMGPDIGAVVRNIDWDVAHETDAVLRALGLEMLPLAKELKLPELKGVDFRGEFPRPLTHRMRISPTNLRIP